MSIEQGNKKANYYGLWILINRVHLEESKFLYFQGGLTLFYFPSRELFTFPIPGSFMPNDHFFLYDDLRFNQLAVETFISLTPAFRSCELHITELRPGDKDYLNVNAFFMKKAYEKGEL